MQHQFSDSVLRRLKQARESAHCTLADLAQRTGYAVTTLSSVENGHDMPSDRLLKSIIKALDINQHWLETGQGPNLEIHEPELHEFRIVPQSQIKQMKETAETLRVSAGELIRQAEKLEREVKLSEQYHAGSPKNLAKGVTKKPPAN